MAKNYKYSFKLYSSWNYENELEDLNKYSERGWQLVKDGMFHRKFVKNENIRYRYQMDLRRYGIRISRKVYSDIREERLHHGDRPLHARACCKRPEEVARRRQKVRSCISKRITCTLR